MDRINYGSSSDEDAHETIPKKRKIQLFVDAVEPIVEPVKMNKPIAPKLDLFAMLPAPKTTNEPLPGVLGGGVRGDGQQAMIQLNLPKKEPIRLVEMEETQSYFTLDETPEMVIPTMSFPKSLRPTSKETSRVYTSVLVQDRIQDKIQEDQPESQIETHYELPSNLDAQEMSQLGYRSKRGPIHIRDVKQSTQLGDTYERNIMMKASREGLDQDSGFHKLEPGFVPSEGHKRNNNIMTLAYKAKSQSEQLVQQEAQKRAMKKVSRAAYGF